MIKLTATSHWDDVDAADDVIEDVTAAFHPDKIETIKRNGDTFVTFSFKELCDEERRNLEDCLDELGWMIVY